ncbi:hypothetical protein ACFX12_023847 [Malus domestica]
MMEPSQQEGFGCGGKIRDRILHVCFGESLLQTRLSVKCLEGQFM